jgi:hypothetical protein
MKAIGCRVLGYKAEDDLFWIASSQEQEAKEEVTPILQNPYVET